MIDFPSYITGFVDGEGSFLVSFSKREKMQTGIEVRPSFTVSQHRRSLKVVEKVQKYFGVGGIRLNKRDNCYKYEVRSISDLMSKVIPHFKSYPLQSSKENDFQKFSVICEMVHSNHHLNE